MKTILLASHNPVKKQAVLRGFRQMFNEENWQVRSITVPSGVRDQPLSDAETLSGASNRARAARQQDPSADYWVGIEGGVEPDGDDLAAFAWVVVLSPDRTGRSRSGTFFLPPAVCELVRQGKELGEADDIVFGRSNSKQENGAIGILTGDVIDRASLYEHAVILALAPFRNPDLYPPEEVSVQPG